MIELVFVACLTVNTSGAMQNVCEVRSMTFTDVSPMTCMIGAQGILAEWAGTRPGWRIGKWKCGPAGNRGKTI